jgi:hypothetical protein
MTDDKLLHVSCMVHERGLWELLRAMELHKVGNVQVRPVMPLLALPPPSGSNGKRKRSPAFGKVQPAVRAAMQLKQKRRVPELAKAIGAKPQSTYSAVAILIKQGVVKRVSPGLYMRTKPDPVAQP